MSRKGFILIVFLFIISIGMISSVSAEDSGDVLSNSSNDEVGIGENGIVELDGVEIGESGSQDDGEDVLEADAGTFTALQNKIKSASEGSTINLYNNYTYNTDFNNGLFTNLGIYIDKTLTINGNGYSIDGLSKTRLCGVDGSNVKLKNIVFKNGYSHLSNGAIFWPGFKGVLENCTFINCICGESVTDGAVQCGAVQWSGANAIITKCNFNNCHSVSDGGALYLNGINAQVTNCNFANCYSGKDGGAIYSNSNGNTVQNCKFDECSAGSTGGAICFEKNSADSSISGCDFKNCTAVEYAGAVYCNGSNGALSKCNFYDCYSEDGGAIYWDGVGGTVSNSKFIRCNAEFAGAIDWDGNEGTLTDCEFTDCKATDYGGAVYWGTDNSKMVKCNFNGCNASNGGAVYSEDSIFKATISGCKFINCAASEYGGALLFDNARNLIVESSTFSGNSANNGGAIESYNSTVVKVSSSTFSDNIAEKAGGAVWAKKVCGIQLDSSDFVHNSAKGREESGRCSIHEQ